jgi:hypothetical protein
MSAPQSGLSARLMLRGLGWDVGLHIVGYYALHLAGVHDFVALLVASALAAARIVWVAVRERALNPFATVMLVVFGIGLLLAFVSGDPRFLLLKNSVVTGVLGLVFLATTLFGTPLTLAASQSFQPARKAEIRQEYDTDPHVRRGHRLSSTVWGVGLILEALIKVPLVFLLPISVMVALGEVMTIAAIAGLLAWNIWYVKRASARGSATSSDS